jgi:hypothetical protein
VFDIEEGAADAAGSSAARAKAMATPASAAHRPAVQNAVPQRAVHKGVQKGVHKAAARRVVPAGASPAMHHESRVTPSMPIASGAAAQTAGASAAEQDWETF